MSNAIVLAQNSGLNAAGWTVLIACVGLVVGLCIFCFYRILRESTPSAHHHAPLDIDTHDQD